MLPLYFLEMGNNVIRQKQVITQALESKNKTSCPTLKPLWFFQVGWISLVFFHHLFPASTKSWSSSAQHCRLSLWKVKTGSHMQVHCLNSLYRLNCNLHNNWELKVWTHSFEQGLWCWQQVSPGLLDLSWPIHTCWSQLGVAVTNNRNMNLWNWKGKRGHPRRNACSFWRIACALMIPGYLSRS